MLFYLTLNPNHSIHVRMGVELPRYEKIRTDTDCTGEKRENVPEREQTPLVGQGSIGSQWCTPRQHQI